MKRSLWMVSGLVAALAAPAPAQQLGEDGYADSNGVKIHYVTLGQGPPVVMIHGFPDYWYTWRKQMPELARDYQVVAVDMRGYNKSDQPEGVENYAMPKLVGDIDAETLGKVLDHVFGGLPAHAALSPVADANPPLGPSREIIEMDVPQSVVQFGHRGIARKDDDFMPAYMLNYILGGGGFASRLMEEVREKRGLAYSVHSNLYPYQHGAVFIGNVATKNEAVGQSLEVIESELKRLAEQGPTEAELENAKSYLTGAYALRFESSSGIANQLLWIQIEDLGIDYVGRRNALVDAVTLDDIKRVARRLIEADRLITTIVGKPVAAKSKDVPG